MGITKSKHESTQSLGTRRTKAKGFCVATLLTAATLLGACSGESNDTLAASESTGCSIANENRTADIPEGFDTSGFLSGANYASGEVAEYLNGGSVSPGEGSCPSGQWGFNSAARKTCCSQSENPSAASTPQESAAPAPEGTVTALALFGIGRGGGCLSRSQVSSILEEAQQRGYTVDRQLSNFMSAARQRPASRAAIPCGPPSVTSELATAGSTANASALEASRRRAEQQFADVGQTTPPTVSQLPTVPSFMDRQLAAPTTTTAVSTTPAGACTKSRSGRTETCTPTGRPGNTNFGPSPSMGLTAPQP